MVSPSRPRHRYTYAQYAALERESSTKHEFFDGEIYAMAGGSEDHAALAVSILAALRISVESLGTELIVDTMYRNSSIAR